jgi:biotin carboxyl carrier protein
VDRISVNVSMSATAAMMTIVIISDPAYHRIIEPVSPQSLFATEVLGWHFPLRYFVTFPQAESPVEVDVRELPSGQLEVLLAGQPVDVDLVAVRGALSLRVDGRVVDLTTEGTPPDIGVVASGHRSYLRVESARQRAAAAAASHGTRIKEDLVRSPMPGRVVRVLVAAGDMVEPGQPLVVIEAMKMENELRAKHGGQVAEILVAAGAAVEGNAKLIRFVS